LVAAHFNHRLRGAESDADEAFVTDLCRQLGLPCELGCPDRGRNVDGDVAAGAPSNPRKGMAEEDAREARYRFIRQTAKRIGARIVATAHTADDQAETVLHRILRGTGIAGLAGIRRSRQLIPGVAITRPMLAFRRSAVIQYLQALRQPFREDSTNSDVRYTRNRIRHELMPQLVERYNANVVEALMRLASMAEDAQTVIDGLVDERAGQCVTHVSGHELKIDCSRLESANPYVVREMLISIWKNRGWPQQAMSYDKWGELAALAMGEQAGPSKSVFPGSICAERRDDVLVLLAMQAEGRGAGSDLQTARGQD
jgi:tRNA(Ile)-lysidine synthase